MTLPVLLANAARSFPDRPAVSVGLATVHDYAGLAARAARLAAGLAGMGLQPGDRVAIGLRNCPEYLEILFGCWWGGFVAAPMNAKLHAREMAFMAGDCAARLVLADDDTAAALAPLLPGVPVIVPGQADHTRLMAGDPAPMHQADPGDLAWLFYTSGTTGSPKGAMLSHRNLVAMAVAYLADVDALTTRDALIHLAATSHASGLFGLSFVAKAANNILPESGGYDAAELAGLLRATDSASFFVPPTLLRRMAGDDRLRDLPPGHLRTILCGAAPVWPADIAAGVAAFGPVVWNGYGQGESPCTITAMSKDQIAAAHEAGDAARLGSVGIARTGTAVRLVDDAGRPVPAGAEGEVAVRGETVMAGYWNRPEATAEALRDGWLLTGDMGRMDAQGFLTLLDRKKDVIISGGSNIYAREVEDVLTLHPAVAEAAVIGLPDPEWGEAVVAVLRLDGPAPARAELESLVLDRLARWKRPKRYVVLPDFPRNAAGKVLKRALRETLADKDCSTIL
jgi:long-chain acyl-CoA synthetase